MQGVIQHSGLQLRLRCLQAPRQVLDLWGTEVRRWQAAEVHKSEVPLTDKQGRCKG